MACCIPRLGDGHGRRGGLQSTIIDQWRAAEPRGDGGVAGSRVVRGYVFEESRWTGGVGCLCESDGI